jgi:hypothetical protein
MLVCMRDRAFPLSRLESRLRCPRCGTRLVRAFTQIIDAKPGHSLVRLVEQIVGDAVER